MKKIIEEQIFKYPKRTFLLTCLFFSVIFYGILSVKLDFGVRIWFPEDSKRMQEFDNFVKTFGSENYLFIGMSNENESIDIFNNETISIIHTLTEKLISTKQVDRVDSLSNFTDIGFKNGDANIAPFLQEHPYNYNNSELKALRAYSLKHSLLQGKYISSDGKNTLFLVRLGAPLKSQITYKKVLVEIQNLFTPYKKRGYHFRLVGTPHVVNEFRNICERDFLLIIPLLSIIIAIFIYLLFKSYFAIFSVFTVIVLTNLSTIAVSGYLGMKLNNLSSMVPGVLMAICIADTIHFLTSFYIHKGTIVDRLKYSFQKNLKGTLLTTLTTTIGFASLSSSVLVPIKDFGILCAIGTIFAWLYTLLCIFPLGLIFKKRLSREPELPRMAQIDYSRLSKFCIERSKSIVISFSIFAAVFIYISTFNQVNSNPFKYFNPQLKVYKDNVFFNKKYGGFSSFEISIDSGKQDEIYAPLFLNNVHKLQLWIKKELGASYVGSILDYQLLLNQVFHNNDIREFRVPKDRKTSAELLTYYQMNLLPGQDLNSVTTIDNRVIRASVFWDVQSSKEYISKIEEIHSKAKELELNIKITGREYLFNQMNSDVVVSFFKSIIITIIGISIFLVLIFKSFKFGIISLFPNFFPVLFGATLMAMMKRPLDIGTVLVASVCFGIAVDDTIHFLLNVQKKIAHNETLEDAFNHTFTETGTALLSTTLILVCSFTVFLTADFTPNQNFGLFSAVILLAALFTDFIFLPALITMTRKRL